MSVVSNSLVTMYSASHPADGLENFGLVAIRRHRARKPQLFSSDVAGDEGRMGPVKRLEFAGVSDRRASVAGDSASDTSRRSSEAAEQHDGVVFGGFVGALGQWLTGPSALFGSWDGACKTQQLVKPIMVDDELDIGDDKDEAPQSPYDSEKESQRKTATEAPAELPDTKKRSARGRRADDTASALSMSSHMTSSAASLLGGLSTLEQPGKAPRKVAAEPEAAARHTEDAEKAPAVSKARKSASVISGMPSGTSKSSALLAGLVQGEGKARKSQSVIAGGKISSGSGQALSGLQQKQKSSDSKSAVGTGTRVKGQSKSVIAGSLSSNSNANALLAGMVQKQAQPKSRSGQSSVA